MVVITFCTIDKKIYNINIPPEKTIEETKQIYIEQAGINNSSMIKMAHNKKILEDQTTVGSLSLKENDFILVISPSKRQSNQNLQKEEKLTEVQPIPLYTPLMNNNESNLLGTTKNGRRIKNRLIINRKSSTKKNKSQQTTTLKQRRTIQNKHGRQNVRLVIVFRVIPISPVRQNMPQLLSINNSKQLNLLGPLINFMSRSRFSHSRNALNLTKKIASKRFIKISSLKKVRVQLFNEIRFYIQVQFHVFVLLFFFSLMKHIENQQQK